MNIAYFTEYFPDPLNGGIEAVSNIIAGQLSVKGHNTYSMFFKEGKSSCINDGRFTEIEQVSESYTILNFIKRNKVDIIINQCPYHRHIIYSDKLFAATDNLPDCRVITCYHSCPGFEMKGLADQVMSANGQGIKGQLRKLSKILSYPLYKFYFRKNNTSHNRYMVDRSYKYILLSDRFKDDFIKFNGIDVNNRSKIGSVNNPLRFDSFAEESLINKKEKMVLIVARLSDHEKKISRALRVWSKICETGYEDWRLVIVGDGPDRGIYEKMTRKLSLKNVEFTGMANPEEYYRKASIFFMTSDYEGWGMTLTECMQLGVVPVAIDNYRSLHDMIENGRNGCIIPSKSYLKGFTTAASLLMRDDELRNKMAINAVESSKRFLPENIATQWESLLV